ncbi:MAG TPA: cell division protein FtsL [Polyangiales bacterium]|jgi:cell division protein FtsL|nr:cell division protein FtsL [Polyangiales bacterium]
MKARFLMLWSVAVVAAALSFIVHLTLRFETVRLGYDVGSEREQERELIEQRRLLALEAATLREADRVETVARGAFQMDVVTPPRVIAVSKGGGGTYTASRPAGRAQ